MVLDEILDIDTPHGPARAHVQRAAEARGGLLIGHGAGGSIAAPDILEACGAALTAGVSVARIEQPYKVAGRRSAAPAKQLDAAWLAVHAALCTGAGAPFAGLPILSGGRSSGARVACRTAAATSVTGIVCLAFPLHPPGRPEQTRLPELDAVDVPVLVIQGERDPFGMPPVGPGRTVVAVAGDHSLKAGVEGVAPAVAAWLPTGLGSR
jgi:predicted alpha/beta-hydrolase family hydrolase